MTEIEQPASPATPAENPNEWFALTPLYGRLVTLKALGVEHAEGVHAALWADDAGHEVYRWLGQPPPGTIEQARDTIYAALAQRARGERFPYVQLDARTGEIIGTTSYYEVAPAARAIAIGHTWLGRRWWRTGHNTESKLLMLRHAFDTLGAARVVWHTDMLNERSRAAISRLGAQFEGELRKHRIRANGTWRNTAQFAMTDEDWPACRDKLEAALHR